MHDGNGVEERKSGTTRNLEPERYPLDYLADESHAIRQASLCGTTFRGDVVGSDHREVAVSRAWMGTPTL